MISNLLQFEFIYQAPLIIIFIGLLILGKKFFNGGVCNLKPDLSGQIVLITGANSGIGKETALELAKLNATVVLGCRNMKKAKEIFEQVQINSQNKKFVLMELDLSSQNSVRAFVKNYKTKFNQLNILINNAGILNPSKREVTEDGLEMTMASNYFGHYLLTNLLKEILQNTRYSRVINVSSEAHLQSKLNIQDNLNQEKYQGFTVYSNTKFANILFTKKFQRTVDPSKIKVVSLHPGVIRTNIFNVFINQPVTKIIFLLVYPFFAYVSKNSLQGAQTTLYCALEEFDKLKGGEYYKDCTVKKSRKDTYDLQLQDDLWSQTKQLIKYD